MKNQNITTLLLIVFAGLITFLAGFFVPAHLAALAGIVGMLLAAWLMDKREERAERAAAAREDDRERAERAFGRRFDVPPPDPDRIPPTPRTPPRKEHG